jgi:hypothetical protein
MSSNAAKDIEPLALKSNAGLGPLLDSEEDPARLWAEIHRLRAAVQGPDGYATWQDAATAERVRRVRAENEVADAKHAMRAYARENPRYEYRGLTQDPNGAHGWLARNDRA